VNCNICSYQSIPWGTALILGKYNVSYYRCAKCGFVQTDSPFWLNEAYSSAITKSDIGLVNRNLILAKITQSLILSVFDCNSDFIDFGGGYGLLVRLMRDAGMHFYRHDKYCENLFAKGFDAPDKTDKTYEMLTAFEVLEHLPDPLIEIEKMLKYSSSIFFSTILLPKNNPKPGEWWYYGVEHGQHVSLYSRASLDIIASTFNLKLYSHGNSFHLLTTKSISPLWFSVVCRSRIAPLIRMSLATRLNSKSLIQTDYANVT